MLNQYPMWKNVLVAVVMFFGALYALPNIYSQDPVIEVTGTRNATVSDALQAQLEAALKSNGIRPKRVELTSD
ncbi:MAG: protein translocase subunit SecD, partial [Sedimenticolaceae bacterium]